MFSKTFTILNNKPRTSLAIAVVVGASLLMAARPASAHHAMGGETPNNLFEGFLSGIAHPLIGLDHFAFIVAVGLLAALKKQGSFIPVAFILLSLAGTGIHLLSLNLPAPELLISTSVLAFGVMLAMKNSPHALAIAALAAVAGLFHGYAYGEAIVGAEMTPLVAYLAGFTLIQLAIALSTFLFAKLGLKSTANPLLLMRFSGFTICGVGAAFLSFVILP